jgi:cytoplasmic iron level regulating protein YaaA (DUF328/UPF0246 family)
MSVLLVQSCSASKQQCSTPIPAIDLYTGYFYRIINKSKREDAFRDDINLRILSAEYGLIHPDTEIACYDRRMTAERAAALRESILDDLVDTVREHGITHVVVNAGATYRKALNGVETRLGDDVSVSFITGSGNGEMGGKLKSFIRADEQSEGIA